MLIADFRKSRPSRRSRVISLKQLQYNCEVACYASVDELQCKLLDRHSEHATESNLFSSSTMFIFKDHHNHGASRCYQIGDSIFKER